MKESFLLTKMFKFQGSSKDDDSKRSVALESLTKIKTIPYIMNCCGICLTRRKRFKKMIEKSEKSLRKDLDLQKFIMSKKLSTVAILS